MKGASRVTMKRTGSVEEQANWLLSNDLRSDLIGQYASEATSPPILTGKLEKIPLSRIAYHTAVLAEHGLIELIKTTPRGGSTEHFYLVRDDSAIATVTSIKRLISAARAGQ